MLKEAQADARAEAKRLQALEKKNRQKSLDASSKAEGAMAGKQKKGAKQKQPKRTSGSGQSNTGFAEVHDDEGGEDGHGILTQTSAAFALYSTKFP